MLLNLVASFAMLLATFPLHATTYHVSPQGSNHATGTSFAHAWKRIDHAARLVRAGDQVLVHKGIYKENIHIRRSGVEGAPIRFEAASKETIIQGALTIEGQQWIEIVGFTLKGSKSFPPTWKEMPLVVVDDPSVGLIDPREDKATRQLKVKRKFKTYTALRQLLEDGYHSGILVRKGSRHITIRGNTIANYTLGIFLTDHSSFVLAENNDIHHCRHGIWSFKKNGVSATDIVIRANRSTQNLAFAIEFRDNAQRVLIEDNVCQYNGIGHIAVRRGSSHAIIRNNHVEFGGYYAEAMRNPGSSALNLHTLNPGANILVEGNFVAYQQEPTWDSNGIIVDLSPEVEVVIRNNVFYRNMGAGVALTKSSLICVYNNTMVENGYRAVTTLAPLNGQGVRFTRDIERDNRIVNNIFYKNRIAGLYAGGHLDKQAHIDHNLYMVANQAAAIRDSWDETKVFANLKEVQTYTAVESNGIEGAPRFKDPDRLDFRLQKESPALDRGGFLTRTTASGSGTLVPVEDAGYFYAGFGDIAGDKIVIGANPPVFVTNVDRLHNRLTVERPLTWDGAAPVSLPFSGNAPDIGAFEFFPKD